MENLIDSIPINNEIANPFLQKPQEILQNTGIQAFQKKENRVDVPDYFGVAASKVQKPFFKETPINIEDKYDVVFGKLRPKYESYVPGIDNAEYWAQRQSWGDKLANGLTKMGLKGVNNVIGGTIGFVNGVAAGLKEGQFHAFSHNSFSEFLDETNKLLDNQLPNRLTREYQNRNFLQKLTKVDFWAGEVGDAFAFMAGTIGSELIWGAATGGSSWALSAAKWAARGAKGAASVAGKLGAKGVEMGIRNATAAATKATLKGLARNVNTASKGRGMVNNLRFVATSSGFEAGVEARGSFDENIQEFQNLKMQQENRMPTFEEYQEFIPEAISASNAVFRTNVAILAASNAIQFGKVLGLKKIFDIDKFTSKVNKYAFGKGVSKLQDGTYALYKSNAAQRITGKTFDWFKNPIVEGAEEGLQGVANRYFGGRLMSKYDPESAHLNMTMMESFGDSMYESFLTKEGFNEVGIGMLIGKLGGVFRGGGVKGAIKNVASEIMPGTEYKADIKALEETVQLANQAKVGMDKATRDSIVNFSLLNQQIRATADGNRALELGDAETATRSFHAASFYKMQAANRMGMLKESYEDYKTQLELMDATEFAEDFGIPEQSVEEYKQTLAERYKKEIEDYEVAEEFAKNLDPHSTLKGLKKEHFQEEVAFNFFMGLQGLQDIDAIGRTLEQELGAKGIADQLAYFNALTEKEKELSGEITKINRNVKNLETRYANLQMEYSTLLEQSKRVEENTALVRKIENNRKRAEEVLEEKTKLEAKQKEVKEELEKSPKERGFIFGSLFAKENKIESTQTVIESVEALDKLDSYLETLRREDPEKAAAVETLIDNYKKTVVSLQEVNKTLKTVTDPRYRVDAFKGVGKILNRYYGRKAKEEDSDEFRKAIDDLIEKTEGIDEYEAAFIHSMNDLIDSVVDYDTLPEAVRDTIDMEEVVENEEFKNFIENGEVSETTLDEIVDRKENELPLTRRQSRIAEQKTKEIEDALNKRKKQKGDSLRKAKRKAEKVEPVKSENNIEVVRQLIQDILDRKKSYINKKEDDKEVPKTVNDFTEESIPTEEEYRRYDKLKKDSEKRPLSVSRQKEFDALQEKISDWGNVEGTVSGKYKLLDLYTELFELEEQAKKDTTEQVSEGEHAVEPTIEEDEAIAPTATIPYNILQTYDKVFYSVEDGKTAVSNLSVRGLLEHLGKYVGITAVKINGKKTDLDKIDRNKDNIITIEYGDKSLTFTLSEYRGRLVFDEENKAKLLEDGNLRIGHNYKGKPMTAYQVVMHEVQGESIPLQSSLEGDLGKANVSEIQSTQVGAEVRAVVDLQDPYNSALLEEYNKREGTKNPMSIEEFRNKLKIEYMNGEVFIGYLKQNHPSQKETNIQKEAVATRDEAARLVLENQGLKTVETGVVHKVKKVFLSQPHLNIVNGQVRMSRIKEEHKDKIDTVGYIENGEVTIQNDKGEGIIMSFVNRIIKDKNKQYKDKRVPIVILNFAGKRVAYPVEMIENTNENAPQEFDDILNKDVPTIEKVVEIYRLLSENGIDPSTTQLRTDNFSNVVLEDIRQRLVDNVQHPNIKELTDSKTPAAQIASENMMISIDLDGNMFHSPKVVLDYGAAEEVSKPIDEITEEDLEGETAATEITTEENEENIQPTILEQDTKKDDVVEAKKVDIEKRRQEELNKVKKQIADNTDVSEYEKIDLSGYFNKGYDMSEAEKNKRLADDIEVFVENNDSITEEDYKNYMKTQGHTLFAWAYRNNIKGLKQGVELYKKLKEETSEINAKYDAELKALEEQQKQNNSLQLEESMLPLQSDMENTKAEAGSVVSGEVDITKPKVGKYEGTTDFEVRTPEQLNVDDVLKRDKPIKLYPEQIVPIDDAYSEKESNWVSDRDITINEGHGNIEIKKGDKLFIRVDNPKNGDATSSTSYKVYIKGRGYPLLHFIPETAEQGSLSEPNYYDAITQMKNFDKVISGEIETPQQSKEQRIKIAETLIPNEDFYVAKPYNTRSGFESPQKVIFKDGKWLRLRNDEWDNTKDYEYNVWGEYADKNELAWDIVSNARVILKDKKSTNLQEQWYKQFDYLTSENKKRVSGKPLEQSLQEAPQSGSASNPALKGVESTAKALEGVDSEKKRLIPSIISRKEIESFVKEQLSEGGYSSFNLPKINNGKIGIGENVVSIGYVQRDGENKIVYYDSKGNTIKSKNASLNEYVGIYEKALKEIGSALTSSLKISEAYHKAKADGSNPELVAAVEALLGQKSSPSVQPNVRVQKPTQELTIGDDVVAITPSREVVSGKVEDIKYREDNGAIEYIVVEKEDGTPIEIYNRGGKDGEYMPSGVKIIGKSAEAEQEVKEEVLDIKETTKTPKTETSPSKKITNETRTEQEGDSSTTERQNETPVFTEYGEGITPQYSDTTTDADKEKLKPHQVKGVNAIVTAINRGLKGFLLADGAGAGKTRQLLVAAKKLAEQGKKVLIITENKQIIEGSFKDDSKELGYKFSKNEKGFATTEGIEIVTAVDFRSKISPNNYDVLIIDESQNLSGLDTIGGAKLREFNKQVVFSSATPFDTVDKTLYILPKLYNMTQDQFLQTIGARIIRRPNRGDEVVFSNGDLSKFQDVMNKAHNKLIAEGKMLHRRYDFFGEEDLEMIVDDTTLEGRSLEEAIEGVENAYKQKTRRIVLTPTEQRKGVTEDEKRRQLNEQKVNEIGNLIEAYKASDKLVSEVIAKIKRGEQVVIYGTKISDSLSFNYAEEADPEFGTSGSVKYTLPSFFVQMTEKLKKAGVAFETITGDNKKKETTVENFQSGKIKVLLVNQTGTTGINLNDTVGDAPRTLYIAGTIPNAIQLDQLKGRVSRMNSASKAKVVYLNTNTQAENKNKTKRLKKVAVLNSILTGEQIENLGNDVKVTARPQKQEKSDNLVVKDFTDKTFIVSGNWSEEVNAKLKSLKGRYTNSGGNKGYYFPNYRKDEVLTELGINKQNITTSTEVSNKAKEELNKDCK